MVADTILVRVIILAMATPVCCLASLVVYATFHADATLTSVHQVSMALSDCSPEKESHLPKSWLQLVVAAYYEHDRHLCTC